MKFQAWFGLWQDAHAIPGDLPRDWLRGVMQQAFDAGVREAFRAVSAEIDRVTGVKA